ncbi:hypothetical protein EIP91_001019 [Steccherinum ochraceum]|uniref:Alpha-ketoglutarate-dependent dioxygenase AlkB-like domain-containing protein n=1 Tax=Steccherinum ochraceum TaxID=92696 RepID=A0A4R0RH78_9APHY|nr:hypothetical protein EIP91_001019 [Steccherinum ochraceum]
MRIPESLTDRGLLEDEPFLSRFLARKLDAEDRRGRHSVKEYRIPRSDFESANAIGAATAWLVLAFATSNEADDASNDPIYVSEDLLQVFAEFYFHLYQGTERDAIQYLHEERKRRMMAYSLDLPRAISSSSSPSGNASVQRKTKPRARAPSRPAKQSALPTGSVQKLEPIIPLANNDGDTAAEPSVPSRPRKRPKNTTDKPKDQPSRRQQPRREASKPDRLSLLVAQETKSKTGRSLGPVATALPSASAPPTLELPSQSVGTGLTLPSSLQDPLSAQGSLFQSKRAIKKPKLRGKKGIKKHSVVESQVAKRRRTNDGSPCLTEEPDTPSSQPTAGSSSTEIGHVVPVDVTMTLVQEPSSADTSEPSGTKRKRPRKDGHPESSVSSGKESSQPQPQSTPTPITEDRQLAPLPSPRASSVSQLPLPPPVLNNNLPFSPQDVDGIIREAASEALGQLQGASEPRAVEWDGQVAVGDDDAPPDSSDDEEDTPLRDRVSAESKNSKTPEGLGGEGEAPLSANLVNAEAKAKEPKKRGVSASKPGPKPRARKLAAAPLPESPPKPSLPGYPPIWAQSRQEVCESFDWFRSYQGGVYFVNDMVKGYLLGAFSASRDIFHDRGKLIVSHGGGRGADSLHHKTLADPAPHASDQLAGDKSVRALLKTMELRRPLVLIIDDKYNLFPHDLAGKGCAYAVLGFYRIAYAWAEKQPAPDSDGQVVRYKFAFQWCQEQGDPWWWNNAAPASAEGGITVLDNISNPSLSRLPANQTFPLPPSCRTCRESSPQVYAEGWMCLKPSCSAFFTLNDGPPPVSLTYSDTFTRPLPFRREDVGEIRPPQPSSNPIDGVSTGRHACKGFHCRKCGRLSSRFKWEHWECRNCGNVVTVTGAFRYATEFKYQAQGEQFVHHRHAPEAGIIKSRLQLYNYGRGFSQFVTFTLPEHRGHIHCIFSAPFGNLEADKILALYQEEAKSGHLKFRRWPLRSHKCRGTLLTNYFSQNTGEEYHYIAGTENTVSWEEAPAAVIGARKLINERMQLALNKSYLFNEVLSAGYMEKQKMAFHSDAEKGLGGTVASLSLGASAYMHFRLHARFAKELPKGSTKDVLSLYLRHGDVVVMEGADIQKYYEHTVVPLNFRIAATARNIDNSKN